MKSLFSLTSFLCLFTLSVNVSANDCKEQIREYLHPMILEMTIKAAERSFSQLESRGQIDHTSSKSWAASKNYKGQAPMMVYPEKMPKTDFDKKWNSDLYHVDICYRFWHTEKEKKEMIRKGDITGACGNPMAVHVDAKCNVISIKKNTM